MAYSANIVTVAEMQFMAGEDIDSTGDAEANHTALQDQAEAYLSNLLKHNLGGTGFTDLDSTTRIMITEWAARYCGMQLIAFKFTGEAAAITRIEAEDRINLHIFRMQQIEKLLTESTQDFLGV